MKLIAPTSSGSFSFGGMEHKIIDGLVDVEHHVAALLTGSHGFVDPDAPPPAAKPDAAMPAAQADSVTLPRATLLSALKSLGIATADNIPADTLVKALTEGASRQAERVAFEIKAAEDRAMVLADDDIKALTARAEAAEAQLKALTAPVAAAAAPAQPEAQAPAEAAQAETGEEQKPAG